MNQQMKALCVAPNNSVELQTVPRPEQPVEGHLLIKVIACGVNPGDHAFIAGIFPKGSIPTSNYDIAGVSGVGIVEQIGSGVPSSYTGRKVAFYRSLKFSDQILGAWCETARMLPQHCVLLPNNTDPAAYAGSLVNIITPYAFLQLAISEGHKGILATAGNSATGLAMLGVCLAYNFPLLSIARNEEAAKELTTLGAKNILIQTAGDFKQQLAAQAQQLDTTAIFDGIGGAFLNATADAFPQRTTIYSYGYLGGNEPLTLPLGLLMRRQLTIKSFGNFTSPTVRDTSSLEKALAEIGRFIHQPHFKTKIGRQFSFEQYKEALTYSDPKGGKAVLIPSFLS